MTIVQKKQHVNNLADSQIINVWLSSESLNISMDMIYPNSMRRAWISCSDVVQFSFSRTMNDDGCYSIYEAALELLEQPESILKKLNYSFHDRKGNPSFGSDKGGVPLWYFHVEGDVCVDIVSRGFDILIEERRE